MSGDNHDSIDINILKHLPINSIFTIFGPCSTPIQKIIHGQKNNPFIARLDIIFCNNLIIFNIDHAEHLILLCSDHKAV